MGFSLRASGSGLRPFGCKKGKRSTHVEAISRSEKPKPESRSPPRYRPPNPADCIDCREMSAVEAMPCMRSLKSSALEAFSSAVS